jgi:hypothetical protein
MCVPLTGRAPRCVRPPCPFPPPPYQMINTTAPFSGEVQFVSLRTTAASVTLVNEVQTITCDAIGGSFSITIDGYTAGPIAWDASEADVQVRQRSTLGQCVSAVCPGRGRGPGPPHAQSLVGPDPGAALRGPPRLRACTRLLLVFVWMTCCG